VAKTKQASTTELWKMLLIRPEARQSTQPATAGDVAGGEMSFGQEGRKESGEKGDGLGPSPVGAHITTQCTYIYIYFFSSILSTKVHITTHHLQCLVFCFLFFIIL